jgi:pimeloyl-ACP methyl ester carboxylesterase
MASRQTEGFPSAHIEIFEDSGHWPFADNPGRTRELVVPFITQAIADEG